MSFWVRGVRVEFADTVALDDVGLEVPAGSVVAVVGGDGAGKSTLLRCLVGRIAPVTGEVRRPEREQVGYMPSTSGTWSNLTVSENVDFVGRAYGMSGAHLDRRRAELLERADLATVVDRRAGDLSGGMRQKLGFVLAVLHEPELLVLDEPTTGVDPVSRVELWRLVVEAAASGAAVAMATTYLDEAERAGAVTVLDRGRVIAEGTRESVMATFPGTITAPDHPSVAEYAWRRAGAVREWHPAGSPPTGTDDPPLSADALEFEDVVIARLLDDRLVSTDRSGGRDHVTGSTVGPT